ELAKSQGVEVPTRGGEIGLIVLEVHPGSPAEEAGLQRGDILLSMREEDETEPWEMQARGEFLREDPFEGFGDEDLPDEFAGRAGPPWRSPRNFLNERLTRIGEGQKVELVYLRGAVEQKLSVTLKAAPADFENARKYKSEDLGLTFKDLTYEVRGFYRMKPDAPGVVVAKVEPAATTAATTTAQPVATMAVTPPIDGR